MTGFVYKSYNFIDKDPMISEVRGVFDASGRTYQSIEDDSGVTSNTLRNWFFGKTRKPQAATVNAVLRSMGFKLGIVPYTIVSNVTDKPVAQVKLHAVPTPKTSVRHVVQMSKYKKGKS